MARHLRVYLGGETTDVDLLARYAERRDEAAFAALVRHYGRLVFGLACRPAAQLP
jgi:hypothetical protein